MSGERAAGKVLAPGWRLATTVPGASQQHIDAFTAFHPCPRTDIMFFDCHSITKDNSFEASSQPFDPAGVAVVIVSWYINTTKKT